ncbi:MAG TPA: helix-turn-helix transcriptional regulator [Thermoanaerobaculia bacterium]|nr:helix-turn-helix transcriptional regulator [Thermoanaerobaculia bacterium]
MPDMAAIAQLLGDPTRARMLGLLMDGQAQTATELALAGGVLPSTASSHLTRLTDAGLLTIARQGRHRYFRIAGPEVAAAIEGLMSIAPPVRPLRFGPREEALRRARVCYDHLAGEMGVRLLDGLRGKRVISGPDDELALTRAGEAWCERIGIDLEALRARRRRLCRQCLDWSQRRAHLAGSLGQALLERLFALRYARREAGSRAVVLSPRGEAFVERLELA